MSTPPSRSRTIACSTRIGASSTSDGNVPRNLRGVPTTVFAPRRGPHGGSSTPAITLPHQQLAQLRDAEHEHRAERERREHGKRDRSAGDHRRDERPVAAAHHLHVAVVAGARERARRARPSTSRTPRRRSAALEQPALDAAEGLAHLSVQRVAAVAAHSGSPDSNRHSFKGKGLLRPPSLPFLHPGSWTDASCSRKRKRRPRGPALPFPIAAELRRMRLTSPSRRPRPEPAGAVASEPAAEPVVSPAGAAEPAVSPPAGAAGAFFLPQPASAAATTNRTIAIFFILSSPLLV